MAPVDLMKINSEELAKFLDSFDHVISDCDGVLWASEPLPGVGDFIKFMKQIGKKVHFLSNNSIRSDENYSKFFKNAGIEDGIENLTIPSKAIAEYLKSINFDKHVYCVTCQETIKTLEANGFKCKYGTMAPVNLVEANLDVFQKFLDSFDHVFSDCDEGTGEFIKLMKQHGKKVHFLSNNSMRSKEEYKEHFDNENLTIPSIAIAEYLKSMNFDKQVYCVTCPETKKVLESYGFKCKYGPDVGFDNFADYGQYLKDDLDIGAVVFDSDYKVNMPKMYKAQAYLRRPEVLFFNGPTDKHGFIGEHGTGLG
ncbi:hypothetical protein MSG28_009549 [Choristoneura fumiferana]|uniref:Uncharacterized protein n=2 Tax=Choristoneura fumiferana TaxID=7141 RepID=A0ACC0JBW4_CHOFU|nr:hypothetical protein MSG28_009549 [Choristoneura fumiferana]KAI8421499.1 hypothetical protein MSG28_009549 [Choristoneura fumiferana]